MYKRRTLSTAPLIADTTIVCLMYKIIDLSQHAESCTCQQRPL